MRKKLLIAGALFAGALLSIIVLLIIVSPAGPRKVGDEYQVYADDRGRTILMGHYRAALDRWTVPFQEMDVDTSFGKTHVIVSGEPGKRPLLLLHGAGGSAASWYFCAGDLRRRYRLYAIDTMGDLGKSRPVKLPAGEDDYARWLDETMTALGIERADVMGISYGGYLAHCLASRHPERVGRVVMASYAYLSGPIGVGTLARMLWYAFNPTPENMQRELEWFNGGPLRPPLDDPAFLAMFRDAARHGRNSIVNPTAIAESSVRAMRVPIMIVIGEHDPIYTPAKSREYCRKTNPAIRFEVVAGDGHLFPLRDPARFSAQVLGFLE